MKFAVYAQFAQQAQEIYPCARYTSISRVPVGDWEAV